MAKQAESVSLSEARNSTAGAHNDQNFKESHLSPEEIKYKSVTENLRPEQNGLSEKLFETMKSQVIHNMQAANTNQLRESRE